MCLKIRLGGGSLNNLRGIIQRLRLQPLTQLNPPHSYPRGGVKNIEGVRTNTQAIFSSPPPSTCVIYGPRKHRYASVGESALAKNRNVLKFIHIH